MSIRKIDLLLFTSIVATGLAARLLPHPPNVSPILALAFMGAYFWPQKRSGALIVVLGLFFSDLILGFYPGFVWNYASLALAALWAQRNRFPLSYKKWLTHGLEASAVFFILSNLGVFVFQNLYPKSLSGLFECYLAAIPFLKNSLIGDFIFIHFAYFILKWTLQTNLEPNKNSRDPVR